MAGALARGWVEGRGVGAGVARGEGGDRLGQFPATSLSPIFTMRPSRNLNAVASPVRLTTFTCVPLCSGSKV